jgi:hypothetical protein
MKQRRSDGEPWDNIKKKAVNTVINSTVKEDLIALRVALITTENQQRE